MVRSTKLDVIYKGIENPITILVEGVKSEDVVLKSQFCEFKKYDSLFTIIPKNEGEIEIEVYKKSNGKLSRIGSSKFRCSKLGPPTPYIGNLKAGDVKLKVLEKMPGLIARWEDAVVNADFEIVSFYFSVTSKEKEMVGVQNTGGRFNSEIIDTFKKLKVDDRIVISAIKLKYPDSTIGYIRPIEYLIVE